MTTEVLNFTSGDAAGTSIALDGELVIGRSSAELPGLRDDPEMSRVHARIWRTESGELRVEDLGSRNGTFLNDARIRGPHVVQPGDSLRVGRTRMELVEDEAPDGAPSYDALVEDDEPTVAAASGSSGHARLWPMAAIIAALLAGAGVGAAVASSHRAVSKSKTVMVTREVEYPAPRPRIAAPAQPVQLPAADAREAFATAFCGGSASAPKAVCRCTYVELTRREAFPVLLAQVDRSHGRRIDPAIVGAARACGAKGPA